MVILTISILLLLIALTLETTILLLPLVFLTILLLFILVKESWVFIMAIIVGVFLDILSVRAVGQSSMFFIVVLFTVLLYERKYEIRTYPFIFVTSLVGSIMYHVLVGKNISLILLLIGSFIISLFFAAYNILENVLKKNEKKFMR